MMKASRHLIDADLWQDILLTSKALGYCRKGKDGLMSYLRRLNAYSKEHPDLFRR